MFDPFGDHEQAGYLRNVDGLKDLDEGKAQEHAFFLANVEDALAMLRRGAGRPAMPELIGNCGRPFLG